MSLDRKNEIGRQLVALEQEAARLRQRGDYLIQGTPEWIEYTRAVARRHVEMVALKRELAAILRSELRASGRIA